MLRIRESCSREVSGFWTARCILRGSCVTALAVIALVLFCGQSLALEERLDPSVADSIAAATDDPYVAADAYNDAWLHEKALQALEAADREASGTLWRLARSRVNIAENLVGKEVEPYYEQAYEEAEKAVELAPDDPFAHYTLAVAAGRVALQRGIFTASGFVKATHRHALQAAALSDSFPRALYVLGRTHKKLMEKSGLKRRLGGLNWARNDSVIFYFESALDVSGGGMIQCRVEYADFLLGKRDDKAGSREQLDAALELQLRDEQDVPYKERARKMLVDLEEATGR